MKGPKYICPDCGDKVVYWSEYMFEVVQNIHPTTGEISKRKTQTQEHPLGVEGVKCVSCGWYASLTSGEGDNGVFDEEWERTKHRLE